MKSSISIKNEKFHQTLFSSREPHVYAVLDGASVPDIVQNLADYNAESICLYRGELDPELAQMAPYLVILPAESELADWALNGIGRHWGIFATSKASMKEMRKHFRTILTIYAPDGEPVYFRYYDPRVLSAFLPTCNEEEKKALFGVVNRYYFEDEKGTGLSLYEQKAAPAPVNEKMRMRKE